jgi:nucleoside-diphosphate-sugar epimerase
MVAYNTLPDFNVLITGGAGFITFREKSHRIKRLLQ